MRLSKKLIVARLDECGDLSPDQMADLRKMKVADLKQHVEQTYGWTAANWEETEETAVERMAEVQAANEQGLPEPDFSEPLPVEETEPEPTGIVGEIIKDVKKSLKEDDKEPTEPEALEPWDFSKPGPFPAQARLRVACLDETYRTLDEIILAIGYTVDGAERKMKRSLNDIERSSPGGLMLRKRKRSEDGPFEYQFEQAKNPELASVRAIEMARRELAPLLAQLSQEHDSKTVADLNALLVKYS